METSKYSPEERRWADALVAKLKAEFPLANVRQDEEYFIYNLTHQDRTVGEAHTPKWGKIPIKLNDKDTVGVDTEKVILAELRHRHEFGDEYSLAKALALDGAL